MKVGSIIITLVSWLFFMRPFDVNNNENALFPCLFKVYFKIFVENIDDRTVIFRNLSKFTSLNTSQLTWTFFVQLLLKIVTKLTNIHRFLGKNWIAQH